jgi:protein-tyrosine phosphatase
MTRHPKPTRLLFVCYGNIIRSPLAESLFRQLAAGAGLADKYLANSAGTSGLFDGVSPDPRICRVAAAHGLELDHRSRGVTPEDYGDFDVILAMDTRNLADLRAVAPSPSSRDRVRLLREFDPLGGPDASVPDPIRSGPEAFEGTYAVIERSVRGLLEALERMQR